MNRQKDRFKLRLIICFSILILIVFIIVNLPDQNLHLVFCDVGQGDAILVHYKNKQVLIDGGPPKKSGQLLSCLSSAMPFWDRRIEVVVNTHPDEDHFGGLVEVVKRYRIDTFLHNGYLNSDSWRFENFQKALIDKKVCSKITPHVEAFSIDKVYFESIFPFPNKNQAPEELQNDFFDKNKKCSSANFEKKTDNLNNKSIVLRLSFDNFDAFLTGDIEAEIEKILVWRKEIEPVEVLKIAHHGAGTSTTEEILSAADPQLAVISVGENSFGHPADEVLKLLEKYNIPVKRTDEHGTIEIISDGKKWWVR